MCKHAIKRLQLDLPACNTPCSLAMHGSQQTHAVHMLINSLHAKAGVSFNKDTYNLVPFVAACSKIVATGGCSPHHHCCFKWPSHPHHLACIRHCCWAGTNSSLAPADAAAAAQVDKWLQWEAGQLRAAAFTGGDAAAAALTELEAALGSGPFLAGSSVTLADVSNMWLNHQQPYQLVYRQC